MVKRRKPWLAALLSFVCPGAGQLYNGNLRAAFVALPIAVALYFVSTFFLFGSLRLLLAAIALGFVFDTVFSVHAYREAKRLGAVALQPYQRWWIYVGFGALLYGLPDGYGNIFKERLLSFQIPSESMVPTLVVGDRLVADGWAYAGGRDPERGDIVVFKFPRDESIIYVKRLVGLPGDTIQFKEGEFYLNGAMVEQRRSERPSILLEPAARGKLLSEEEKRREADNPMGLSEVAPAVEYVETLGSRTHLIHRRQPPALPNFGPVTVPEDSFFMMGDNRERSSDSRFWGFVPRKNLLGRMTFVYFSWDAKAGGLRGDRFGLKVE